MEILVDLMDTYQSLPDWLKLLWLVVPPGFVLAFTAITLRYRLACHKLAAAAADEQHGSRFALPPLEGQQACLPRPLPAAAAVAALDEDGAHAGQLRDATVTAPPHQGRPTTR